MWVEDTGPQCSSKHKHPWAESAWCETKMTGSRGRPTQDLLVLGGLVLLAIVFAWRLYAVYLPTSRGQWATLHHDRNAHLFQSMIFALDLRNVDPINLIHDLDRSRLYPPLFGMATASILAIGGLDYQLAPLVSLGGWIGTILLVFLLTRQLARSHRNTMGLLAALFALGSPALHTYATDIMLESLGACFSLLALHLYISKHSEGGSAQDFAFLGCALTALFFLKYNYWFLTILILLLWKGISRYREITTTLQRRWAQGDIQRLLLSEIRHPLTWVLAAVVGIAALLLLTGEWEFWWAGRRVRLRASLNLAYLFFLILCIRMGLIWWRNDHSIRSLVDNRVRPLIWCHVLPVTAWLLWPQKLRSLLTILSPKNAYEAQLATYWSWDTLLFYPRAIATEYHANSLAASAAFALAALAFIRVSRLTAYGRLVLLFLTASAILTTLHPNHQSRYVHTWVPLLWIAGAAGLASILEQIARLRSTGIRVSSGILAVLIAAILIEPLVPAPAGRGVTDATPKLATALDLSDYYLPRVGCYEHLSIFATVPIYFFASWSYLQRYPTRRSSLAVGLKNFGSSEALNQMRFVEWLERTRSEAIVLIDIPPGSFFYYAHWPGEEQHQQYRELVESQKLFSEVERRVFSQYGTTVKILVRQEDGKSQVRCNDDQASDSGLPHDPDDRPTHLVIAYGERTGHSTSTLFPFGLG